MRSIRETNKKIIYLITLLSVLVLYMISEPFKSISSEVAMLFTSKSPESIIGYIKSYNIIRPIVSIGLMILQALIFPFKYEIMIFANIKVFGELIGLGLSLIGRIIGAYICYDVGKTLISNKIQLIINKTNISEITTNYMRNSGLVHVLFRMLPLNFDLVSYIAGIMQVDSKKYMVNSIIWITLTTVPYAVKKGYFSYSYEMRTTFIRLILSIIVFAMIAKKYHKGIRGV